MTPAEMEKKLAWLEQLMKTTIARQNAQDKILEYVHDRMLFSPPPEHSEMFEDRLLDELDRLTERVAATNMAQAGVNRGLAELARDVLSMSRGWMDVLYTPSRYIREIMRGVLPEPRPQDASKTTGGNEGGYRWNQQ